MAKTTTSYRCTECGWTTGRWVGRCGQCQAHNVGDGFPEVLPWRVGTEENFVGAVGTNDAGQLMRIAHEGLGEGRVHQDGATDEVSLDVVP